MSITVILNSNYCDMTSLPPPIKRVISKVTPDLSSFDDMLSEPLVFPKIVKREITLNLI
jgi:hypothetical protein